MAAASSGDDKGDRPQPRPEAETEGEGGHEKSWLAMLAAIYPRHRTVFFILNGLLTVANIFVGGFWWAFWPLFVSSMALGLNYLVYKIHTTDDSWAERRVEDLHARSYDRGHIEWIQDRDPSGSDVRRP